MYQQYYGLREKPFSLTPDTDFFYQSVTHQEVLNVLLIAIKSGDGFIKVTGEVGTGKTLLCRKLLDVLDEQYSTVYIPNPCMNGNALLDAVIAEMGISDKLKNDNYLACINQYLIGSAQNGKTTVIILDEAQALPKESLEVIRLLSNLETEKEKLVQIILFGQPELDDRLAESSIRQLRQRIMHSYHLQPLNEVSMRSYLHHRMRSSRYIGPEIFDAKATKLLFKISQGVPRIINILANKAMMQSYANGDFYIGKKQIEAAALDSEIGLGGGNFSKGKLFQLIMLCLLLVLAVLINQYS
jgi:MSHA biogenesis protein MshM